jgi:hypothetical protein
MTAGRLRTLLILLRIRAALHIFELLVHLPRCPENWHDEMENAPV